MNNIETQFLFPTYPNGFDKDAIWIFDEKLVIKEIERLKELLFESDYKIIKLYECFLTDTECEYDANQTHLYRQDLRDSINQYEQLLKNNNENK